MIVVADSSEKSENANLKNAHYGLIVWEERPKTSNLFIFMRRVVNNRLGYMIFGNKDRIQGEDYDYTL